MIAHIKGVAGFVVQRHVLLAWMLPLAGGVAGFALFAISSLTGRSLFIAGGVSIGLVVGLLAMLMTRKYASLVLTEMTVSVPEFSEIKFVVNSDYRKVAWTVFVEIMTRVATQPLGPQEGVLRESLTSLYSLFATVRDILKSTTPTAHSKGTSVELLAVKMLNGELRPFLAKWHPQLLLHEKRSGIEATFEGANECRNELEALRRRLQTYGRTFGELAHVKQIDRFFET